MAKHIQASAPAEFHYEMGYTESEFETVLKGNFSGPESVYHCHDEGRLRWRIGHDSETFAARIKIRQGAARHLGAMQLPVLEVDFSIETESHALQTAFFERFFQYFHKGGG